MGALDSLNGESAQSRRLSRACFYGGALSFGYGQVASARARDARDLGIVQHMLVHFDLTTTEQYYGHYDLTDLEQAMEQFAKTRR